MTPSKTPRTDELEGRLKNEDVFRGFGERWSYLSNCWRETLLLARQLEEELAAMTKKLNGNDEIKR